MPSRRTFVSAALATTLGAVGCVTSSDIDDLSVSNDTDRDQVVDVEITVRDAVEETITETVTLAPDETWRWNELGDRTFVGLAVTTDSGLAGSEEWEDGIGAEGVVANIDPGGIEILTSTQ